MIVDITSPGDLPPALFLGLRDDSSFTRKGASLSCIYRFEGRPCLHLECEEDRWRVTEFFDGHKTGTTFIRGSLSEAISQHCQYSNLRAAEDPWETYFKERIEAVANVQYWLPDAESSIIAGVPDGRVKGLACPISREMAAILNSGRQFLRQQLGTTLVLDQNERGFQFITAEEMTEAWARQIASELGLTHDLPLGAWRIAHRDTPSGRIWRLQLRQRANLAYLIFPWRFALELIDALRRKGIIRSAPAPELRGLARTTCGAVLAGAVELAGQTSVFHHEPWLVDTPVAIGTFPPLPLDRIQAALDSQQKL